jgi:hypothetical protein
MKRSKYTLVAALMVLPLGLIGCSSSDRRVERDASHRGDYIVVTPQQSDYATNQAPSQTFVAGSTARPDVSTANRMPGTVRGSVQSQFPGAQILDVRDGSDDEWVVYIHADNVIRELHVRASDGLVLSSDKALTTQAAIDALPAGVKAAALSRQPGGVIYNVEQIGDTEPVAYRVYTLAGGEQYFVDANANGAMLAEGRATDASRATYAASPVTSNGNRVQAASVDEQNGWRETGQPSLEIHKSRLDRDHWNENDADQLDRDRPFERDRDDLSDPN